MIKKYSLVFIAFLSFVLAGFGQAVLPTSRTTWNAGAPTGWTEFGTGSYASTFACSGNNGGRLDSTGDYYQVFFDSAPNQLTFVTKSNSTTTSSLLVEQSTNGSTYTTLVALSGSSDLPTVCTTKGPYNLNPSSRYIRWTFTKGSSNMTMDDVSITKATVIVPTITASPTSITGLDYSFGNGPSGSQSYQISGSNLTPAASGNITVTAPANFSISKTAGGTYTNILTYAYTGGTLSASNVFVRLNTGLPVGTYGPLNITHAGGGATTVNVPVSGQVTPAAPANDNCSGAISLSPNSSCSFVSYTNVNATDGSVTLPSCQTNSGLDVWFSVVVPASGEITVETSDNGGLDDTVLALYSGTCAGTLTQIACDDDGGTGTMSLLNATGLTVGSTVFVRVLDYGGNNQGTFDICVTTPTPCIAPTSQPSNLVLSNITGSSIDGSFTATTSDEYLVVVSTSAALGANPLNGTSYTNGDPLGNGTVVQSSNATTFTATGLTQTTPYFFFVFALNDASCAGGPTYNITNPLIGNETTVSGPCLEEGFETNGTGAPTDWTMNSITYGGQSCEGSRGMVFNGSGDFAITPVINNPQSLSFQKRRSSDGTSWSMQVQISTNATYTTWVNVTTITSISTTCASETIDLSAYTGDRKVRFLDNRASGAQQRTIDDIKILCGPSIPAPELQLVDADDVDQNCGYTINYSNVASNGSNLDITFEIENIGSLDLDVASLILSGANAGDYTVISPLGAFTVAPSSTESVIVRFSPSANGTRSATLTINNNDGNEGACTVLLTGFGFTPAPNIRVERNTEALIPNGSAPNIGYNTIFATTDIGDTAVPKLYYVRNGNPSNPATADLMVTNINSTNNAEFTLIDLPAFPVTLAPNEFIAFEIEFSPNSTTPITRNSTIEVRSSDTTDDPYIFGVQGNAGCPLFSGAILPTSGPVGTEITITSVEDLTGATATLNGLPLDTVSATTSELIVQIPLTITLGGALTVNLSNGCSFTNTFALIDDAIQSCQGSGSSSLSELIISQVTDSGTDSVTYIEIYNGTGATIPNLSSYSIHIYNNALSTPLNSNYIIDLNNVSLPNGSTYTLALGTNPAGLNCIPEHNFSNLADQQYAQSGVSINFVKDDNFNIGHDHIRLYHNSTHIDSWGIHLNESWAVSLGLEGKGANFMRRTDATLPDINFDIADWIIQDWGNSCSDLDYSDIGVYDFSVGTPPTVSPLMAPTSDCNLSATLTVTGTQGFTGGGDTQGLAYQWYYNAPGQSGWIEVPDDATYDDVNSGTLEILNTLTLDGYQYYCQVREDDATCYVASNAIKLKVDATVWNGANWFPGTPDINTIAIIDGDYYTNSHGSFSACQLIVNANNLLNVTNATFVEVQNYAIINGDILVETHGSFVQRADLSDGFVVNTGATSSVNKSTATVYNWYDYTYWSSPVSGTTVGEALDIAPSNRRFFYDAINYLDVFMETGNNNASVPGHDDIDDNNDDWSEADAGMPMAPGQGFAATVLNSGMFPGTRQVVFSGPYNTGTITTPVFWNGNNGDNDWNLIGNPYPSAISFHDLYDDNSTLMDGAAYLWSQASPPLDSNNGNQAMNFNNNDYAIITRFSGNTEGGDMIEPLNYIPSGQSFFIKGLNNGQVIFNNDMRMADTSSNNLFFRNNSGTETNRLWVNLTSDNGVFNQILMAYVDGATSGDDGMGYDAHRNMSAGTAATIYTMISATDRKFAIQGKSPNSLTLDEVIPLGFSTSITQPANYKLSIDHVQGDFMIENTVYLKDYLLNVTVDLSNSDYIFSSLTGEFNERFEIVFSNPALSVIENEIPASGLTIIELPNGQVKFSVGNSLDIKAVEIIDMLGRTLYQLDGNNPSELYDLSNLSQAAYIAKVRLSNGQVITKRAMKRY